MTTQPDAEHARALLDRNMEWLLENADVNGSAVVADQDGRAAIRIFCNENLPDEARSTIRERFDPVQVQFEAAGPFEAY